MSGVIIKMGIYGICPHYIAAAASAAGMGRRPAGSRRDLRRTGRGVRHRPARLEAAVGVSQHREHRHHRHGPRPGAGGPIAGPRRSGWCSGLAGGLLHVWNHALFKALLFLSAGSVIHATHTREIDHLGGLAKAMPYTAVCFLVGAVAICGLPPLNGFVSEFLIYLGLFGTLGSESGLAWTRLPGGPGTGPDRRSGRRLLRQGLRRGLSGNGSLRSRRARSRVRPEHDRRRWACWSPAACSLAWRRGWSLRSVEAVHVWASEIPDADVDLTALRAAGLAQCMGLLLLGAVCAGELVLVRLLVARPQSATGATWGCGYAAPTARMQYTSSSFAEMLVGLFALGSASADSAAEGHAACFRRRRNFTAKCPTWCSKKPYCPRSGSGRGCCRGCASFSKEVFRRTCCTSS